MKKGLVIFYFLSLLPIFLFSYTLSYTSYHTPAQVDTAINLLHTTYPSLTSIVNIGTSVEGRTVKALKISGTPGVNDPAKGDVVFVALHHAREWISVETALYIADRLLFEYGSNPTVQADINALQIWIIPIVNPDGFEYTNSTFRLWRKNRRNNGDGTFGVDLNRNWSYQWGLNSGSSGVTNEDDYRGTAPFSEPETLLLRDFLQAKKNLKCFVSYHSYSELYLRPWSYAASDPPGESTLRSIALRNINRIASVHGHTYSESIWYTAAGEACDYLWGEMRTAAFTPELRPVLGSIYEFELPESEILPTAEENYAAALALIHDSGLPGLYIRDHNTDNGSEPSAVKTAGGGWSKAFWVSPDIWTVPAELNQGAIVDLNVRIQNATGATRNNVTLDIYYNDPRISLEFPNPDSHLIATKSISVPPGGEVVTVPWTIPLGVNIWGERHWCVGAVVKQENDMPLTTQVQRTSNIGCKNFQTTTIVVTGVLYIAAENYLSKPAELLIHFDPKLLPGGITVRISKEPLEKPKQLTPGTIRKAKLLDTSGILLEPGDKVVLPVEVFIDKNLPAGTMGILNIDGILLPLVPGKREAAGNGYTFNIVAGK